MPQQVIRFMARNQAASVLHQSATESAPGAKASLLDTRQRPLRDLRISVTDRCNFRCSYCMPKTVFGRDYPFLDRAQLLSFEEITRIARVFVDHGVTKIRLTGGEPLLRHRIERLIEMLAALGVELALTTNGSLLTKKARDLRNAGLHRVTVSLDALDDRVFRAMNDVAFPVEKVLEGIAAAADAGLTPVKINAVIKRSENYGTIVPLARHFKGSGHIVRFIEFMDVGATNGWRMDDVVPSAEVLDLIHRELPIAPMEASYPGEVAQRWRYVDGGGEVGVVGSVTQAFCRTCTRARLSTEGMLYTCLFASGGHDLRAVLRSGCSDAELAEKIGHIWRERTDRYSEMRNSAAAAPGRIEMSYIGG